MKQETNQTQRPDESNATTNDAVASSVGNVAGGAKAAEFAKRAERAARPRGHGFVAEDANTLLDKLMGRKASVVGDNNAKNGADRIVDGISIQTKYYATGKGAINACFDKDGNFRYLINGKPMQIEVPKDKYNEAVQAMADKIRQGKVPGINDPSKAKDIVRKGAITYAQARNLAKAGTIESLTYDTLTGAITATCSGGLSFAVTFALAKWNGNDYRTALREAAYAGIKIGGITWVAHIVSNQLARAGMKVGLNRLANTGAEALTNLLGKKGCANLINALRGGKSAIHGAAAANATTKFLRTNIITSAIMFLGLSAWEIVAMCRGRASGKQCTKNIIELGTTTVAGSVGGWGGAIAGAKIGGILGSIIPGAGTAAGAVVGGLIGGLVGGFGSAIATSKATRIVTCKIFGKDDAEIMQEILLDEAKTLANEYLMTQKEFDACAKELRSHFSASFFGDMFASTNRHVFARKTLEPICEQVAERRPRVYLPSSDAIFQSVKTILGEEGSEPEVDDNYMGEKDPLDEIFFMDGRNDCPNSSKHFTKSATWTEASSTSRRDTSHVRSIAITKIETALTGRSVREIEARVTELREQREEAIQACADSYGKLEGLFHHVSKQTERIKAWSDAEIRRHSEELCTYFRVALKRVFGNPNAKRLKQKGGFDTQQYVFEHQKQELKELLAWARSFKQQRQKH